MKSLLILFTLILFSCLTVHAQGGRDIHGTILDSTKLSVPGAFVKCLTEKGDTLRTAADADGKFAFGAVQGSKFTLFITSVGYVGITRHYTMDNDTKAINLDPIVLQTESNVLATV